jgi:hypothetical protein
MRPLLYILLAFFVELLIIGVFVGPAFGQSVLNSEPNVLSFSERQQHATVQQLSSGGGYYVEHGEQPLSVVPKVEEPLGDAARRLKAEKPVTRPRTVYTNQ